MKQINAKPEIIRQYLLSYQEIAMVKFTHWNYNQKIDKVFDSNENMKKLLQTELENYLQNVKIEMLVLKFVLKNEKKLYLTDIYSLLDIFDKNYEIRFEYLQELINNLQTALDMEYSYRFYSPRKNIKYLDEKDYEDYINYVKGFNINRVKEFLVSEEIYEESDLEETLKKIKFLNVSPKDNLDFFGLFENGLVIPKVNDDFSCIVAIHELVHQALVNNKEELQDDEIVFGEELPRFYEGVFIKQNDYVNLEIKMNNNVLEMLKDYKEENFEEQINKLKKLKR